MKIESSSHFLRYGKRKHKKMKNAILLSAILLGLGLSGLAQKNLPAFMFEDLKGESFTSLSLKSDMPTIVIYYDPWCDHCATQASWIAEEADQFKEVQILFVTNTDTDGEGSREFYKKHFGESGLEHVHFLLDPNFYFDGYFGYSETPSIYVYDKDRKRVKSLTKETSAEDLLAYLGLGE